MTMTPRWFSRRLDTTRRSADASRRYLAPRRWQGSVAAVGVGLLLAAAVSFVAEWLAAREVQLSLHDADRQQVRLRGTGQEIKVLGGDGRVAIFAHPPSRLVWSLPLRPGTHRFAASVGIDAEALARSDGVRFRVRVADVDAEREVVHVSAAADREPEWTAVEARFRTSGGVVRVALETDPGVRGNDAYDWALWAEPTIYEGSSPPMWWVALAVACLGVAHFRFPGSVSQCVRSGVMRPVAFLSLGSVLALAGPEAAFRVFPLLVPERVALTMPDGGAQHYGDRTGTRRWDDELGHLPLAGRCWTYWRPEVLRGRHPRPGASSARVEFCTDAHGFRNSDDIDDPTIAVIGDSFVQGSTIAFEDAWTTRLAERVGEPVLNLGVSGFSPQQSVAVLERFGLPRRPSRVLFAFFEGNDVDDTRHYRAYRQSRLRWDAFEAAAARAESSSRVLRRYERMRLWALGVFGLSFWAAPAETAPDPLNPVIGTIRGRSIETAFHGLLLYRTTLPRSAWEMSHAWQMASQSLARARELCERIGARLTVVLMPSKESIYPALLDGAFSTREFDAFVAAAAPRDAAPRASWHEDHLANREALHHLLLEHLEQERYDVIDLWPGFAAAAAEGQVLYWPYDTHLSTRGNALAAEIVANEVDVTLASTHRRDRVGRRKD